MKTAYILYKNYLSPDGSQMSVGGIQTYITNLIPVVQKFGYKVHIYQHSEKDFETVKDGVTISGISKGKKKKEIIAAFKERLVREIDKERDLLIFGCETFSFESKEYRSIAIQHGIFWDKPYYGANTHFLYLKSFIGKARGAWKTIKRVSMARQLVCVDYNFVNWYRALTAYPMVRLNVVPNFSQIPELCPEKPKDVINIMFARRFFEYRGTRIFAKAIRPLLENRMNIHVTVAGAGPDEDYLREQLGNYKNVSFVKFSSDESLTIHADKHIAVVPTLGSEGTSLSLLEAMASGCAVICTNVGGMTNIVLDHYNGIMIPPEEQELHDALEELVKNEELRGKLSAKAYETVSESFSIAKWRRSWERIVKKAAE